MDPTKWLDWVKLSPKYLFGISLFSGSIIFAKEDILTTLGIKSFRDDYQAWVGTIFLASVGLLLVHILLTLSNSIKKKYKERRFIKLGQKRLHQLTPGEKRILHGYIARNSRTQTHDFTDGVVAGLEHAKIIYRATNLSQDYTDFAYNIQPWAWEYLKKHPELVKI